MEKQAVTLKRSLSLWQIVLLGVGYMTPMVVFDTFGITSEMTHGHVPAAYILALAALLLTAASYQKMIQVFPTAGSAYTYTQHAINRHLGFMVGWAALMDYLFLPMVNALIFKIYLSAFFPAVPSWIWVLEFVVLITVLNLRSVNFTANFNTFLVVFQIAIISMFVFISARALLHGKGTGELFSVHPFYSSGMDPSLLVAGSAVLCFSYLGFDAVAMLSEETKNPKKTIPKAIFITALLGGVLFTAASYFAQSVFPTVANFKDPQASSPEIAMKIGGTAVQMIFLSGGIAGVVASGVSSHASVARLLYAMGRDNILPKKVFAYVHPKFRTPWFNILLVGFISLSAMFFSLGTATSFINFGALVAFTFVNLSVIAHYAFRKKRHRTAKGFFSYVIMPAIGAAFIGVLWLNLERNSFLLGITWAVIGFVYLVFITKGFKVSPAVIDFPAEDDVRTQTL
ncbi:APC family permease [Heyndrickxia acidiproducens]|uniref:APC family permease n=1 Tax=Heyndrickxia acidiproducens TaxID=1121084 RepID=UPI000362972F|nr:APC family permease [Heyndrickxia acidiproducens]